MAILPPASCVSLNCQEPSAGMRGCADIGTSPLVSATGGPDPSARCQYTCLTRFDPRSERKASDCPSGAHTGTVIALPASVRRRMASRSIRRATYAAQRLNCSSASAMTRPRTRTADSTSAPAPLRTRSGFRRDRASRCRCRFRSNRWARTPAWRTSTPSTARRRCPGRSSRLRERGPGSDGLEPTEIEGDREQRGRIDVEQVATRPHSVRALRPRARPSVIRRSAGPRPDPRRRRGRCCWTTPCTARRRCPGAPAASGEWPHRSQWVERLRRSTGRGHAHEAVPATGSA